MARVDELVPGDEVTIPGHDEVGIFIARVAPHPIYPASTGLVLVIWWLVSERRHSFDALLSMQDVGTRQRISDVRRKQNLRRALQMGGG